MFVNQYFYKTFDFGISNGIPKNRKQKRGIYDPSSFKFSAKLMNLLSENKYF